ncbi:hypothetical protein [Paraurantiacibacter namhicola]|uniref:Pili assembly chaperone N-terminal domain-containing protein n=1 Tax=Paraurantiacibacter namhicola TaxID=645517 RepID=A0A1C7D5Y4_9SPHN|nr:hypothetical protein [Paraurantiacibacter namhicola]ANU06741.1 hypothetical protein A6F65_00416 [Paraurantiacibacter namhicola]
MFRTVFPVPFRKAALAAATLISSFALAPSAAAQGDLLIAPTRLVLDGRNGGEIILSNIGSEDATYRVTLELRRMMPDGSLVEVEEGAENALEISSRDMVRYAPRRVVLPPNQPQAIRVSARPSADLPDGEYRVHMSFNAIPKAQEVTEAAPAGGGISINLIPIYGITMPIIIRKGQLEVTGSLDNARLTTIDGNPAFAIDIAREGSASLYGDLVVSKPGVDDPVFAARGLGVYPEITKRQAVFGIPAEMVDTLRGPVRIEFREPPERGGGLIMALDAVL